MRAAIERPTCTNPSNRPPALVIFRGPLKPDQKLFRDIDLAIDSDAFKRRGKAQHVRMAHLRGIEWQLVPLRARSSLQPGHCIEHLKLCVLMQTARRSTPERPPFRPHLPFVDVLNAVIE